MKKTNDTISSIFGFIFMIYIIGAQFSVPAFTYQDIKKHDSVLRFIFISPVIGLIKAPVWPYFAYTSFNKDSDKISNKSVDAFVQSMEALSKTIKLTGDLAISSNPKSEAQKLVYWLKITDGILKACDEQELETIYTGWGKSTALLKEGISLAVNGSERETQGITARKTALLNRFQIWAQANSAQLEKVLKKYKIKPLPKSFEEREAEFSNKLISTGETII